MNYVVFRKATAAIFAVFILAVAFWPFIASGVASTSGCQGVGGACGAVLTLFGLKGRAALALILAFAFLIVLVLRSRSLGLPLLVTLPALAIVPHLVALTMTVNNFWGVGFATGLGSSLFGYLALIQAIGPTIVGSMIIWNLASQKREAFFTNWLPDEFQMLALKIFSAVFLAANALALIKLLAVIPGLGDPVSFLAKALVFPVLFFKAISLLVGIGGLCFLWYAIGRTPSTVEEDHLSEESFGLEDAEPA